MRRGIAIWYLKSLNNKQRNQVKEKSDDLCPPYDVFSFAFNFVFFFLRRDYSLHQTMSITWIVP